MSGTISRAMLLCAGEGTRLRPLTETVPKCMVPVGGKPLLEHTIARLARYGVTDIMINLHHLPRVVMGYFGDGERWGVRLAYSVERELLGTAGAIKRVERFFEGPFLVWYGDNLSTCRLDHLVARHRASGGAATMALYHRDDPTSSGIAGLDVAGRITRFLEKPQPDQVFSHWVNAGILVLEPAVLAAIPANRPSDLSHDIFPALLAAGTPLYGYCLEPGEELWWIDTPQALDWVRQQWPAGSAA